MSRAGNNLEAASVALAQLGTIASSLASEAYDIQIIEFFAPPARLERDIRNNMAPLKQQLPDLARELDHIPDRFSGETVTRGLLKIFGPDFTSAGRAEILAFINKPAGRDLGRLFSRDRCGYRQNY